MNYSALRLYYIPLCGYIKVVAHDKTHYNAIGLSHEEYYFPLMVDIVLGCLSQQIRATTSPAP